MVFAPGHFERTIQRRQRTGRERLSVRVAALLVLVLVGLGIFSLTSGQGQPAPGCIAFNYTTMIGGSRMSACGAHARSLCASPPTAGSIDGDFQTELYNACRRAHLVTAHG